MKVVLWIFLNKNGSRKYKRRNFMKLILFCLNPFLEGLLYTVLFCFVYICFVLLIYSKHAVCSHWPDWWHQEVCLASLWWQELNGLNDHLRISWLCQELVYNFLHLCLEHSLIGLPWIDLYPELTLVSLGFRLCDTDVLMPHSTVA